MRSVQMVAEQECRKAADNALAAYVAAFDPDTPGEEKALEDEHNRWAAGGPCWGRALAEAWRWREGARGGVGQKGGT